jgi:hypothetical protein
MQEHHPDPTAALHRSVSAVRESMFALSDELALARVPGRHDLHGFIQTANYNLGRAESQLLALLHDGAIDERRVPQRVA